MLFADSYIVSSVHIHIIMCFPLVSFSQPSYALSQWCDPLGDQNVWGTVFQLKDPVPEIIMLATKVKKKKLSVLNS